LISIWGHTSLHSLSDGSSVDFVYSGQPVCSASLTDFEDYSMFTNTDIYEGICQFLGNSSNLLLYINIKRTVPGIVDS
jgi:hypothetical protein